MARTFCLYIPMAFSVLAVTSAGGEAFQDLKHLEGTWELIAYVQNGETLPKKDIESGPKVIFTADKMRFVMPNEKGEPDWFRVRIDSSRNPRTIDLFREREDKEKPNVPMLGIYEIKDDILKLCIPAEKNVRPEKLAAEDGSGFSLYTFRHVKKFVSPSQKRVGNPVTPNTVEQAVNQIISELPEDVKKEVCMTPEEDLILFHMGLGCEIRNRFGLWSGNTQLLASCGSTNMHPDSASSVIIHRVWQTLRETMPEAREVSKMEHHLRNIYIRDIRVNGVPVGDVVRRLNQQIYSNTLPGVTLTNGLIIVLTTNSNPKARVNKALVSNECSLAQALATMTWPSPNQYSYEPPNRIMLYFTKSHYKDDIEPFSESRSSWNGNDFEIHVVRYDEPIGEARDQLEISWTVPGTEPPIPIQEVFRIARGAFPTNAESHELTKLTIERAITKTGHESGWNYKLRTNRRDSYTGEESIIRGKRYVGWILRNYFLDYPKWDEVSPPPLTQRDALLAVKENFPQYGVNGDEVKLSRVYLGRFPTGEWAYRIRYVSDSKEKESTIEVNIPVLMSGIAVRLESR